MYKLIEFDSLNSTNTFAKENIKSIQDKTVIAANIQTSGYGRFQRKWISDVSENIYISIVLKPENTKNLTNLTQYLCIVLCKTLEDYNITGEIKWPNDILINGKKFSGILCECINKKEIVLGLGVNLNLTRKNIEKISQPATSLNLETEKKVNKKFFQEKLLNNFFKDYEKFMENGFAFIKDDYLKRIKFLGKTIFVSNDTNKKNEYIAKSINEDGALIVVDKLKKEIKIFSGDVTY